tara:strand:+ start:74 stop:277 length:204 start_codon:yes stop_codon:yes gene_type:complete
MTSFTQWAVLEAGKSYGWRMLGIDIIAIEEHLMKHPEYNKDLSLRDNILNLVGEHCMNEIDRNLERL